MTYKDYKVLKQGKNFTIGKFTDDLYAIETKTGYGHVSEYRKLLKPEFNTYDIWKTDREKIKDLLNRPVFCSGYQGHTDFDETKV